MSSTDTPEGEMIQNTGKHNRAGQQLEPVRIVESRRAVFAMAARAIVAGVAAFAGALATASLGSTEVYASQVWAAVAAGSVAVGVVIGVPDKALNTQAPRGEVQAMRNQRP